jgi:hypothetical protein
MAAFPFKTGRTDLTHDVLRGRFVICYFFHPDRKTAGSRITRTEPNTKIF